MNDDDAERVRTRVNPGWRPDVRCASCAGPPTCPQLHTQLWQQAWDAFYDLHHRGEMPARAPVCSTPLRCDQLKILPSTDIDRHAPSCEMTVRELRRMLCLECTERAIGRQLTLDDLAPCGGNYTHYVMQRRATRG